ncbi:hypothetical protein OPQ81_007339 [Rhizoctonia solani]|nr:hypothetical protein OPQ81_007339 [Rhizoctonia solani]
MPFLARVEQGFKQVKDDAKVLFRRKGDASNQATTRSNTPTGTGPQELIRVLGPVTGLVGPIKELVEVLEASIDTYEMAGEAEKEYSELCTRLEATIDSLKVCFGERGSLTMTTSMESICGSIKTELENIQCKMRRNVGVQYLEADGEVQVILGCYRRIDLDLQRLSLNVNWETLKDIKEQAASTRVDRLSPSLSARYNSAEAEDELKRQGCAPGTRVKVLEELLDWAHAGDDDRL